MSNLYNNRTKKENMAMNASSIKISSNLNKLCVKQAFARQKLADDDDERKIYDEAEAAADNVRRKKRKQEQAEDVPVEDRKVDYAGRARRGALYGGGAGALLGAVRGGRDSIGSGLLGALIGGGLGAGLGAGSNTLAGYLNEDIITRRSEPNRLRRALASALTGGAVGGLTGFGALLKAHTPESARTSHAGILYPGLGALAGAGLGALTGGVIEPWLNKDVYSQNYIKE